MKHNFRCEQIVYNIQVLCRRYIGSYMVPSKEITQRMSAQKLRRERKKKTKSFIRLYL